MALVTTDHYLDLVSGKTWHREKDETDEEFTKRIRDELLGVKGSE